MRKPSPTGLFIEQDWEEHFGVIPSVNAGQFVRELSEGDTVTLSLAASFNSFGGRTLELGDIRMKLESADWYRDKFEHGGFPYVPIDVHNLGKRPSMSLVIISLEVGTYACAGLTPSSMENTE